MNYTPFNWGDWSTATKWLSHLEKGIYIDLLEIYYTTESPIPHEQCKRIANAMQVHERNSLDYVLHEFFEDDGTAWHHSRCDKEIEKFRSTSEGRKAAAKRRWDKASGGSETGSDEQKIDASASATDMQEQCNCNASAEQVHPICNANQEPRTNNQIINNAPDAGASVPVADAPSPKRKKKKDDDIQYVDCPEGINPASWSEWMVIRKKKRLGGLTEYGLELMKQECSKADISLQRGIDHCIESGWGGFKAAYIANLPKEKPDPFRVKNPYIPPGVDPNAKVKPWPKTSPWDDPVYEAEILGAIRKSTGLDGGDSK